MKRAIATAVLLLLIAPAAALAACPKTSLADVEDEVMCPVCGVPLGLATEAPQANRERAFIQREADACKSKQQIKDELVAQFGSGVLAAPPRSGFDLFAWLVPLALLGAGGVGVAALAWGWSRRRAELDDGAAVDPELERRLDDELDRFDE